MEKKKDSSLLVNIAAHSALGFVKLKNSIFRKISKTTDEEDTYAERVCGDHYAPFVKSTYRAECNSKYPDEKPMGRLRRSSNIADVFHHAVQMHGDKPCMGYRPLLETVGGHFEGRPVKKLMQGGYKFHSYESVNHLVDCYGRGLLKIGIRPFDKVAILADTCFEWMCMALALMRYNMPMVTLYATLSEDGIVHGLNETRVSIVVTSHELLEKMRDQFGEIDTLRHVIYIDKPDRPVPRAILGKEMMSLQTLRNLGDEPKNESRPVSPEPRDIAILMYTSGSTGVPKAVKISHGNMVAAAKGLGEVFDSLKVRSDDAYIAYLPLAHVFELTCELLALLFGVRIGYSSATTLTDNSPSIIPGHQGDCAILQPTIMAAVPLMLDRVKKAVIRKCSSKGALSARVLELAIDDTIKRYNRGQDATVYDKDIFAQIRSVIGGKVRLIATGSAPLSPETHSFIRAALGCVVLQGYGLTESCAAATCMELTDTSTGGVGCPVAGAYVKLEDWEEGGYFVKDNKGEIILGGEMISAGYFDNDLLTDESFFEKDGIRWFRTGDIGEVTAKGTFKIIDRKKDLVKLQHGEYISLGKVESELKTMNIVENVCAYGNSHHDFIVALVQPNMSMLMDLAKEKHRPCNDVGEIVNDPVLTELVLEMVQTHSKAIGFLRKEIPQRIKLCSQEWTPESGLVTAAMKLCRKEIQRQYQPEFDELYR